MNDKVTDGLSCLKCGRPAPKDDTICGWVSFHEKACSLCVFGIDLDTPEKVDEHLSKMDPRHFHNALNNVRSSAVASLREQLKERDEIIAKLVKVFLKDRGMDNAFMENPEFCDGTDNCPACEIDRKTIAVIQQAISRNPKIVRMIGEEL